MIPAYSDDSATESDKDMYDSVTPTESENSVASDSGEKFAQRVERAKSFKGNEKKKQQSDDDFEEPAEKGSKSIVEKVICKRKRKSANTETSSSRKRRNTGIKFGNKSLDKSRKRKTEKGKPGRKRIRDMSCWVLIRNQPKILTEVIKGLSPTQRRWVCKTGFGSILNFSLNEYPHKLGFYVVKSFVKDTCSLTFGSDVNIRITDDDVHEVLGLPKGPNKVIIGMNKEWEERWREQYVGKSISKWKVTASKVAEEIKSNDVVDRLFKLNFLILMSNIIMEGPTNPYVRQTMLGFVGDIDRCMDYNWCEYLISCLKLASDTWMEDPEKKFYTGSLPFLVYLYLDRVISEKRTVKRSIPTFVGWKEGLVHSRQLRDITSKSIFKGRIAVPIRGKEDGVQSSFEEDSFYKVEEESSEEETMSVPLVTLKDGIGHASINSKPTEGTSTVSKTADEGSIPLSEDNIDVAQLVELINNETTNRFLEEETIDEGDFMKKLEANIKSYEKLMKVCSQQIATAGLLFNDNEKVAYWEKKFVTINKAGQQIFEIEKESNDDDARAKGKNKVESVSPMDEDGLVLTTPDWKMADTLVQSKLQSKQVSFDMARNLSDEINAVSTGPKEMQTAIAVDMPTFHIISQTSNSPAKEILKTNETEKESAEQTTNKEMVLFEAVQPTGLDRPKRAVKAGYDLKSPFLERVTEITNKKLKKEELLLWSWLSADKSNPDRTLFQWQDVYLLKMHFISMRFGSMVMVSVIDTWSCYLNHRENLRSSESVRRFFCYTDTTRGTFARNQKELVSQKFVVFERNLNAILETYSVKISEIDLLFFPIHNVIHYYLVVINLKNNSVDIIDNQFREESLEELYNCAVDELVVNLAQYLIKNGFGRMGDQLIKMKHDRLVLDWQTRLNSVDCGVFVMRHMETYKGGGSKGWKVGFVKENATQEKQLNRLRQIYCHRIIMADINMWKKVVVEEIGKCPPLQIDYNKLTTEDVQMANTTIVEPEHTKWTKSSARKKVGPAGKTIMWTNQSNVF